MNTDVLLKAISDFQLEVDDGIQQVMDSQLTKTNDVQSKLAISTHDAAVRKFLRIAFASFKTKIGTFSNPPQTNLEPADLAPSIDAVRQVIHTLSIGDMDALARSNTFNQMGGYDDHVDFYSDAPTIDDDGVCRKYTWECSFWGGCGDSQYSCNGNTYAVYDRQKGQWLTKF
eukprot:TRINITY_DN11562_c0_g1_i1.p1 TRINITY_DN11562_c0_g1~~TRINITY_DN11562_c0_g1_i1.p1  ORF type:complete len:172 (-),score=30.27 TRINITY_DN11562_c0_g1_i1:426-941(-)